jgi:putative two-component system response regulator
VIMITALSDKQDRLEGIKVGADDFLSRPVDRTELLARVQSLLKLKQRTDELERAESVLFSLARSIEGKDPYTHGHCERLAEYSARVTSVIPNLPVENNAGVPRWTSSVRGSVLLN